MSRIAQCFSELQSAHRRALIPYVMCGFPQPQHTLGIMNALVEGGADIIELGIPFSDPMADGPVIQKAGEVALAQGVGLKQVLHTVAEFRKTHARTPVVLMGYANPIERYDLAHGQGAFVRDAEQSGVDGVLIVDYPPEECSDFAQSLKAHNLDLIFLLAPTSTDQRMADVARVATGYVYYVSLTGVTGSAALNTQSVQDMLPRIRKHVKIPVGVGFGIRDAESARSIAEVADAVVIGSRLIQLIEAAPAGQTATVARDFMREIRTALDR